MTKVAYLLGAGASFGTRKNGRILTGLPIVSEANAEIESFHNWLESKLGCNDSTLFKIFDKTYSCKDLLNSLIHDVKSLQNMLKEGFDNKMFDTPDKLERYLFMKSTKLAPGVDKDQILSLYSKFKFSLCCLLMYEQNVHGHDKRYDAFLQYFVNTNSTNISDDVFIMTWNYDQQIEIAFHSLYNGNLPVCIPSDKDIIANSNVMKINGTANFYNINKLPVEYYNDSNEEQLFHMMIKQYAISHKEYAGHRKCFSGGTNTLLFSWESEWFESKKAFISHKIKNVTQLIVIGYSFPEANNEVDAYIISQMPNLKEIFIQDMNTSAPIQNLNKILSSMPIYKHVAIISITDVSSFYTLK